MVEAKASGIGICPNVNDPHPPSTGGESVHVRVRGHCLRAVSKLHAKPTNHPSSSFTTIGKLSPVGMNVSRSDGSTTDRDPLLERN